MTRPETTGSAGAVTLVALALLPLLLQAESPATVILKGGTHVPWSPPAHCLTNVWVIEPFLGPRFQIKGALGEPGEIFCKGR